jgi:hypothetical protein
MCYAVKHVSTFCRIRLGVLLLTQGAHKTPALTGGGGGGAHTKTPYPDLADKSWDPKELFV